MEKKKRFTKSEFEESLKKIETAMQVLTEESRRLAEITRAVLNMKIGTKEKKGPRS